MLLAFTQFTMYMTRPVAILLFPDGALPSRRWRWVLWVYLGVTGFLLVSVYAGVTHLIVAHEVIFPVMVVFWLSFCARLALSWRRATVVRRQQLKWLLTGCAISLVTGIAGVVAGLVPHSPAAVQDAASFVSDLGFVVLAVSVGLAILRYRLYDIDRIISRTLADTLVTGLLAVVVSGALEPAHLSVWVSRRD